MAEKKQGLSLDELEKLVPDGVIKMRGGKRYPLTKALVSVMGRYGVESIDTEMIEHDPSRPFACHRAIVTGSRGMYTAHGDCGPKSTSSMILPHYIRMSETRAIGRALRWYLGLGETVFDELGEPDQTSPKPTSPAGGISPPMIEKLYRLGLSVDEVQGILKSKGRPTLKSLTAEQFDDLLKWLDSEPGRKVIHDFHIAKAEGRRR